jgi:hypothetical protein
MKEHGWDGILVLIETMLFIDTLTGWRSYVCRLETALLKIY